MELWIRSQDKETLSKIINIKIEKTRIIANTKEDSWNIYLGTYKTKERALEVLDEIQNIIKPKVLLKEYDNITDFNAFGKELRLIPTKSEISQLESYVYEMPKE